MEFPEETGEETFRTPSPRARPALDLGEESRPQEGEGFSSPGGPGSPRTPGTVLGSPRVLLQDFVAGDWGRSVRRNATLSTSEREEALTPATPGFNPYIRENTPRLSETYTRLLLALLEHPFDASTELCSRADVRFASGVANLEEYRSRPARRGVSREALILDPPPLDVSLLENGGVPLRPWHVVPNDVVSEWFARRPMPHADGTCPCCEIRADAERARAMRGRPDWRAACDMRSRRGYGGAALPMVESSNVVRRLHLDVGSHSCSYGDSVPFHLVRFIPQQRTLSIREGFLTRIHLRVTYHLGIPGNVGFQWYTRSFVRMVFPIFGALRVFWGRAVELFGEVTFSRRTDGSRSRIVAQQNLQMRAVLETPGRLEYAAIDANVSFVAGSRPDVSIMGASLQWTGSSPRVGSPISSLREPLPTTAEELRTSLMREDVPSSLLRMRNSTWVLELPEDSAECESASGADFLGGQSP